MSFIRVAFVSIMILNGGQTDHVQRYGTASNSETKMTILSLKRTRTINGATLGVLTYKDKTYYTLEDAAHIITTGTYKVTVQYSEKFDCKVILINNVPGRSHIEIHPGNYKADSKGCILIGISHTDTSVVGSRGALNRLVKQLQLPASLTVS